MDEDLDFLFSNKKKKPQKKVRFSDLSIKCDDEGKGTETKTIEIYTTSNDDNLFIDNYDSYSYSELLDLAFSTLYKKFPEKKNLKENKKFKIKQPEVIFCGNKTIYSNFVETCRDFNREPRHILQFFSAEFGCSFGTINNNNELILDKKINHEKFRKALLQYINIYVRCRSCKTPPFETRLLKDKKGRLYYIYCDRCESKHYPEVIKTNYYQHSFKKKK